MKMPIGGRPAMATTPSTSPQPSTGLVSVNPPMSAMRCVPLTCAMWPTAKKIADVRGLTESHPVLGWGLVLGVVAIAGMPPLGIFMSEFLVVTSTFAREPWLAIVLVLGILIGVAGLFLRLNTIAFGNPRGATAKAEASYVPMFAHLALVFVAGIYMPPVMVTWFQNVAKLLG